MHTKLDWSDHYVALILQRAEKSYERLYVRVFQFGTERRHFTFDALSNDFRDARVGFLEAMKVRAFIAASIIAVAVGTVTLE